MYRVNMGQPILQRRVAECSADQFKCHKAGSDNGGACCPMNSVCCSNGSCCLQGQTCDLLSDGRLGCIPALPQITASASSMTTSTTLSRSTTTWETTTMDSPAPTNTASVPQNGLEGESTNRAWIAGPVVGSIAVCLLIIFCCISCRRKKQSQLRKTRGEEAAKAKEEQIRFEKAELEDARIQRRSIHEAPCKDALPHELYGDDVFKSELP